MLQRCAFLCQALFTSSAIKMSHDVMYLLKTPRDKKQTSVKMSSVFYVLFVSPKLTTIFGTTREKERNYVVVFSTEN